MGNSFISYFTRIQSETGVEPEAGDRIEAPFSSVVEEVPKVEPLADKQCVAWEIDVSNWKPCEGSKTRRRRDGRESYLREKDDNALVGRAGEVTSDTKLAKVILPKVSTEVKMAQCCDDIKEKKLLDLKRWYCMSRPQYQKSCGITSVVSCWNYLFSTLGNGRNPPITQEEALTVLGFVQPFGEIKFGPFTGNVTVMKWFRQLCEHYGVAGKAYYFYKLHGRGRTHGLVPNAALERIKEGLRDESMAFIYHCYNHYFCPIGYEEVAKKPKNAYCVNLEPDQYDTWILIGEPNRKTTGIHWKRWLDVYTDLNCQNPEYFNIRRADKGVQKRKTKKRGGNIHCIMAFSSYEHSNHAKVISNKENNCSRGTELSNEECSDILTYNS